MGCLWERMPSDATKNLVDALGCLPPFPLCVPTSGWERATHVSLPLQIATIRSRFTQCTASFAGSRIIPRTREHLTRVQLQDGAMERLISCCLWVVAKSQGSFHTTIRKQFAFYLSWSFSAIFSAFPMSAQNLMLSLG